MCAKIEHGSLSLSRHPPFVCYPLTDLPCCFRLRVLSLERLMPHVAEYRAARACPYPLGRLHGKVRARWQSAIKYVLNQSSEPMAVRRQERFAEREEKLMLRYLARVAGQANVREIVQEKDMEEFWKGHEATIHDVVKEKGVVVAD